MRPRHAMNIFVCKTKSLVASRNSYKNSTKIFSLHHCAIEVNEESCFQFLVNLICQNLKTAIFKIFCVKLFLVSQYKYQKFILYNIYWYNNWLTIMKVILLK